MASGWRQVHAPSIRLLLLAALLTACAANGVYHVVEPGQTFYRIAKAYSFDEAELARINGIKDPTRLVVGQRLYIPGTTTPRKVPAVEPPPTRSSRPSPPPQASAARPTPKNKTVTEAKPAPNKPLAAEPVPGPRPAPGTFLWPVRGQLVGEFGTVSGKSSKGVEIAVPHGTPVTAAAAGKVIYSGDGIRGYGNLIILEHADNYFTVYGFNAKNLVRLDSFVGQGEKIALSGTPSGGKSSRLHFEIRKGKTAVNPIFFLP